jgi:Tol biopolymer transport system component
MIRPGIFIHISALTANIFCSIPRGATAHLETLDIVRLTETKEDETCARYAPDMQTVVFLKNSAHEDDIFILDSNTDSCKNLTNTPAERDGWPMFDSNGTWIYYSAMQSGLFHIYRISPDGSGLQQLTQAASDEEHARVYIAADDSKFIYNNKTGETISIEQCSVRE